MISKIKNWSKKLGGIMSQVRRKNPDIDEKLRELERQGVPPHKVVETALRKMMREREQTFSDAGINGDVHYPMGYLEDEVEIKPKKKRIRKTKAELQEELEKTQAELKVAQEYAQVVKELVGIIKDLAVESTKTKVEEAKNTVELMKEIRAITDYVNKYETERMLEELRKQKEILEMKKELKTEEWADTFEDLLKKAVPDFLRAILSGKGGESKGSSSSTGSSSNRVTEE